MWTVGSFKLPHPKICKLEVKMSLAALGTEKIRPELLTDELRRWILLKGGGLQRNKVGVTVSLKRSMANMMNSGRCQID